ncbi:MAG: alkaline phosphatase family protein [Planctomycetales bacterium]|nr:alkaline phosphatase family protein [Planctomycetales bacterium]
MNRSFFGWLCLLVVIQGGTSLRGQPMSLVIGIDGMGFGEYGFSAVSTPNMDRLIGGAWQPNYNGSYSDQAFAGGVVGEATQQATLSGPGWSTVLTGVWANRHRVPDSNFFNPDFENNPTYLETLEESVAGIHSATIVAWSKIHEHILATANDANSQLDFRSNPGGDLSVTSTTVAHIGSLVDGVPAAVFVQLTSVDTSGHLFGSGGVGYGDSITYTDSLIGQILDAVSNRPHFAYEDWQVIVTSDHGQKAEGGHGGHSDAERLIPLIISSKNITQGALAPAVLQGVSHADVAPTVLGHFGVPIPSHYFGGVLGTPLPDDPLDSDFDADGDIDGIDFLGWQRGYGPIGPMSQSAGDANYDTVVDSDDLAAWGTQFGGVPVELSNSNFDIDNNVDGMDFLRWQRNAGAVGRANLFIGDANRDGNVGKYDFQLWESQFGQAAGTSFDSDFDGDNRIDGRDFLQWQRGYGVVGGAEHAQGDASHNGAVDSFDLGAWEAQFGRTSLPLLAASVPEPGTCVLLICGFFWILLPSRRPLLAAASQSTSNGISFAKC